MRVNNSPIEENVFLNMELHEMKYFAAVVENRNVLCSLVTSMFKITKHKDCVVSVNEELLLRISEFR